MKIKTNIITLLAALGILASCNDDIITPTITVGEADNAIILRAGMAEGGSGVQTRADGDVIYHKFEDATKLRLRVNGTWLGHTPVEISKITTATTAATPTIDTDQDTNHINDTHTVTFTLAEQLYWDDYGSADPANMPTSISGGKVSDGTDGRSKGLTIHGVAVNGQAALPNTLPETLSWTDLTWEVPTDQTTGWLAYDLLTSNNVVYNSTPEKNNAYTFAQRNDGKLLIFTHAMSKVTINLTAGKGFPGYELASPEPKFQTAPKVTLLGFYYTGKVNIESKLSAATTSSTHDINAYRDNGATWISAKQSNLTALVFPNNTFTDATNILKIEVDGNIYYVNATKINEAMPAVDNKTFIQGKNYVFNITIDKTEIHVTATIKDWIDVTAETETPKIINLTADVGTATVDNNTKQRMNSFDFYLSDAAGSDASTSYEEKATANKPEEGADGSTIWTFADGKKLYWPNHQIHYFMRGVSPASAEVTDGKIVVSAGDYDAGTSPSNLLVGAPVIPTGIMCGNGDHTQVDMSTGGICAREGKVNLTFDYMMSQVEVRLTTAASGDSQVNLTNAKVEIIGGYTTGEVNIHNKTVTTSGSAADFEVKHVGTEDTNYRHSIVVPQSLTDALKFKITIYKSGSTTDVDDIYYATIKNIKVTEPGDTAPKLIEKWDSGKHYVYTLYLEKTELKVTATITDWVTVTASDDVWF